MLNKASQREIAEHLLLCDADFVPPLSDRVDLNDYAQKIARKAMRFEAWSNDTLVGLVAAYCNDQMNHIAYITSVSVLKAWTGKGIATRLVHHCIEYARAMGMRQVRLEVACDNKQAVRLYAKSGFIADKSDGPFTIMNLYFKER